MAIEYNEIGKRIALRRKELNMTQETLTNLTDISTNQISNIENSRCIPTIETLLKLCDALDTTPNHLLLGAVKYADQSMISAISQTAMLCTEKHQKLIYDFISLLVNENY